MARMRRLTSMIPFLQFRAGEWWVCRIVKRESVEIKGESRDCYHLLLFYAGQGSVPPVDDIVGLLGNSPTPVLIGANKAVEDAVGDACAGKFIVLRFDGQKKLAGGKKFNQWSVDEIELDADELENIGDYIGSGE